MNCGIRMAWSFADRLVTSRCQFLGQIFDHIHGGTRWDLDNQRGINGDFLPFQGLEQVCRRHFTIVDDEQGG